MATSYTISARSRYPLVVIETIILSIFTAYYLTKKMEWDWLMGIVFFLVISFTISLLFHAIKLFRYIFAIMFSILWGFIAFAIARSVNTSELSQWAIFHVAIILLLLAHTGATSISTATVSRSISVGGNPVILFQKN